MAERKHIKWENYVLTTPHWFGDDVVQEIQIRVNVSISRILMLSHGSHIWDIKT